MLPQLKAGASDQIDFVIPGVRLNSEEVAEKLEVGLDAQKCFTEVNKYGDMKNGIGVQVMDLKAIEVKKSAKEIASWQCQAAFNKVFEENGFPSVLTRSSITGSWAPLNKFLALKKTFLIKVLKFGGGKLTFSPLGCCG